ncbi:hypothetical protein KFK09_016455 [Dendrobium nobile]|uniref:Peptidase S8/S53 domain-containing protein n=1 Tax=Dendrobium nobile TaxID=94219 RepID=A0A8T3AZI5_DENNO|nr:hypothetical protein KFK09_016455 [Dendrobium nobile]
MLYSYSDALHAFAAASLLPRHGDRDGHSSHTASTGASAANASLLGYASGTARGMCTSCRIAAYKVCWASGCFGSDILAGIDREISDVFDVLSLSLGGGTAPFFRDTIVVGSFAAAERGIFVACSAGNSGPGSGSITNAAPWIATVGAGTIDRDFPAFVTLDSDNCFAGFQSHGTRRVSLLLEHQRIS